MDIMNNKVSETKLKIRRYWFGDYSSEGWDAAPSEANSLFERFRHYSLEFMNLPSWSDAVSSGFCSDRGEYYDSLRDVCILWSQDKIRSYRFSDEARLIKLVLILREADHMMGRVAEQISMWERMMSPAGSYDDEKPKDDKQGEGNVQQSDGITLLASDIARMKGSRSRIARDIIDRSEGLLPNSSALIGPLVAARLLAEAGSLARLAQMPASSIQILGAKNAFFSHRSSGSPPPKHGLIFEHKRIHTAKKRVRGRVARTLSASLAIALKIDCYRGHLDPVFLKKANYRIEQAGICA